jgi:DNA helicase-4
MVNKLKVGDSDDMSYKGKDLMELTGKIVACLGHISENYYFGITVLISVLRGDSTKQIVKHKLYEVPEYGNYADMSRDDMRAVVQWMIHNHYMLKTKAKYPVLHPTYEGNHFDECITNKQIKDLKNYLEDPNREIFEDD